MATGEGRVGFLIDDGTPVAHKEYDGGGGVLSFAFLARDSI